MASSNQITNQITRRTLVFVILIGAIALLIGYTSCISNTEKLSYLNHNSNVKYVGMNSCASCHKDKHSTFIHTGMGMSFDSASRQKSSALFGRNHIVIDSISGYSYYPFWRNDSMFIKEFIVEGRDTIHNLDVQINYIVGSGQHTNSHLVTENGYIYQAPITFYVQKQKWDLAPGFENGNNSRFSRMLNSECISCHNSMPVLSENTAFKFQSIGKGIDCERCHGPGELHVEQRLRNEGVDVTKEIDRTIVNPRKLSSSLQIDLCQRCHLQGLNVLKEGKDFTDFKPGMKLSDVFEIYLPEYIGDASEMDMANHSQRLQMSKCYSEQNRNGETLTCISCHNPHISVNHTGVNVYNATCNKCHAPGSCTESSDKLDKVSNNCVSCHMPQRGSEDIPHVSVHDHKIGIPISKENAKKVKKLIGLYAVNNSKPTAYSKTQAYLEYWEKFDKNPFYLQKAKELLTSIEHNNLWLKYYYLVENWQLGAALKLDEKNLSSWELFMLGECFGHQEKYSQATYYLTKAYNNDKTNLDIALRLMDYLIKGEKWIEGLELAKQCDKEFRINGLVKNKLAELYILNGRLNDASQVLREATLLEPLNLQVWETHLNLAIKKADSKSFKYWSDKILTKFPNHPNKKQIEELLNKLG